MIFNPLYNSYRSFRCRGLLGFLDDDIEPSPDTRSDELLARLAYLHEVEKLQTSTSSSSFCGSF